MKYIDLEFLPFKINKKYNRARNEINCDEKIKLFGKYESRLNLYRHIFNKTEASFFIDDHNDVDEIDKILIDYYGTPRYVASNQLNVWKIKDIYITHGLIITRLDEELHIISVSILPPPGLYDYNNYRNILKIYDQLKTEFNFKKATFLALDIFCEVRIQYESTNYSYLISINKRNVEITITSHDGNRLIPQKRINHAYKNSSEIYDIVYNFLKSRIVCDTSLYK